MGVFRISKNSEIKNIMYKKRLPIGNLFPTVQSFNNIVKYYNNLKIQKNIITTYKSMN